MTARPLRTLLVLVALLAALAAAGPAATAEAVVGGGPASRAYPHMAALFYDGPGDSGYRFSCGGSLVRSDWILTAAHCVVDDRDGEGDVEVVPPSSLRFLTGTQRLDGDGEALDAAQVVIHERYLSDDKPDSASFDIALVRLAGTATKGAPIALAGAAERDLWAPGRRATVIGWGVAFFGDVFGVTVANQLQEVDVPIRSDAECERSYALGGIDETTQVCAGELHGTKDACQGDSGGPLMVPDTTGRLLLAGVVSTGTGCGYPTQYGIYARVADTLLRGWIEGQLPEADAVGAAGATGVTGATGGSSETGGGAATAPAPAAAPRGSAAFRRCATAASRAPGLSARRRALARCQAAERRRVAYRRCARRASRLSSGRRRAALRRCRARRTAAARRDALRLRG
jgi:secreted trypsin-like serine protease